MTKALIWKEWREGRLLLLGGLGLAAFVAILLLAGSIGVLHGKSRQWIAEFLLTVYGVFVWPTFAVAAGSMTFSSELSSGALESLLSRPVDRKRIWAIKTSVAAMVFLMIVLGSIGMAAIAQGMLTGEWHQSLIVPETGSESTLGTRELKLLAGLFALLFSASVLISVVAGRMLVAMGGGLALALLTSSAILVFCVRVNAPVEMIPVHVVALVAFACVMFLSSSLFVMVSGELLNSAARLRRAANAVFAWPIALALFCPTLVIAARRLDMESIVLSPPSFSPGSEMIAVTVSTSEGRSPEVWALSADGSPPRVLSAPLGFSPAISPDGKWVAYLSSRTSWGLSSRGAVDVRVVGMDGSGERRVGRLPVDAERFFGEHGYQASALSFSPDGKWILAQTQEFTLLAFDGSSQRTIDSLSGVFPLTVAWSADKESILFCGGFQELTVGTIPLHTVEKEVNLEIGYDFNAYTHWFCPFRRSYMPVAEALQIHSSSYSRRRPQTRFKAHVFAPGASNLSAIPTATCTPRIGVPGGVDFCEGNGPYLQPEVGPRFVLASGSLSVDRPPEELYTGPAGTYRVLRDAQQLLVTSDAAPEWRLPHEGRDIVGWLDPDRLVLARGDGTDSAIHEISVADLRRRQLRIVFPTAVKELNR